MSKKRRGFLLADAITGLAILAILGTVFARAAGWQRRASERLADFRAASRFAERTLVELQQGHAPPTADGGEQVRIEPAADGEQIVGYSWVRVTGTCNKSSVTLLGLAKRDVLETH